MDTDDCLEINEGCEAIKQGACLIDDIYLIRHITSTDLADCQVMSFFNSKYYFCQQTT